MIGKNCPVVQNLHENKVKKERMKIGFKPNSIPKISAVIQHYNILKKNLNYGPNHVSVNTYSLPDSALKGAGLKCSIFLSKEIVNFILINKINKKKAVSRKIKDKINNFFNLKNFVKMKFTNSCIVC